MSISAQFFDENDYEIIEESIIPKPKFDTINLSLIDSLVAYSKMFMGVPYRYGGMTARGFDCSGFVCFVFNNFGIKLQRTASSQYTSNINIDKHSIMKGDLVFFGGRINKNKIGHVGIAVSDMLESGIFYFIHSSVTRGITISASTEEYYQNRYLSACRVFVPQQGSYYSKSETIQSLQTAQQGTENKYHTLKKGETLWGLAKKYNTKVDSIRKWNNINNNLKIGQRLVVKQINLADPKRNSQTASETGIYIVKQGDTLYKISKLFNISVDKLKKNNNLIDNNLRINQKLFIN
jgi:LysM repeat protein